MSPQTSSSTNDISITRLERRLRAIQETFADRPGEERRGHLVEEVQHALEEVPHDERTAFLQAVRERFPNFAGVASGGPSAPATSRSDRGTAEPNSSPSDRNGSARVTKEVESSTPTAVDPSALGSPAQVGLAAVRRALRLNDSDPINADRLYQLAAKLIETIGILDKVAGQLVGPRGAGHTRPIESAMNRCVRGRAEYPSDRMNEAVDSVKRRVGSLITMIAAIGDFAQEEYDQLAPGRIEQIIVKGKWNRSREDLCWEHYRDKLSPKFANGGFKHRIIERIKEEIDELAD